MDKNYKNFFSPNGKVIFCWCKDPEEGAVEQAKLLADQPWVAGHVALMPDTHQGYGMPIGGIIATNNVIVPNAVGVDIGCGMAAVKTSLTKISSDELKNIMTLIRKWVPVGFNKHKAPVDASLMPSVDHLPLNAISRKQFDDARYQLGTLGGGNHFIEIQYGSDGYIWFMVHSGSRRLGLDICNHHKNIAEKLNKLYYSYTKNLEFLPLDTPEGKAYWDEMQYALAYAQENRNQMIQKIQKAFKWGHALCKQCRGKGGDRGKKCSHCNDGIDPGYLDRSVYFDKPINIHHNYAAIENHFGRNVVVHRKGATLARAGTIGIIPGSQGTQSYIVEGKGSKVAMDSCSHGAGRKMSRTKAQKTLNLEYEQQRLDKQGILHAIRNTKDLDEAAGAYKDIDIVMAEQADLVDIKIQLKPLGVIKG